MMRKMKEKNKKRQKIGKLGKNIILLELEIWMEDDYNFLEILYF